MPVNNNSIPEHIMTARLITHAILISLTIFFVVKNVFLFHVLYQILIFGLI